MGESEGRRTPRALGLLLVAVLPVGEVAAQTPDEVPGAGFSDPSTLVWSPVAGADVYNVYRGELAGLRAGDPSRCHGFAIPGTAMATPAAPAAGGGYVYLVTAESSAGEEGTPGASSSGTPRELLAGCGPVMRAHVLDRSGYGWSEWSRDRIQLLGLQGYIDEQLDPASIDESTNAELSSRLTPIDPPVDIFQLIAQQVVRSVYARRQLEQQMASFWANHFNTHWGKVAEVLQGVFPPCQQPGVPPQCDPAYPAVAYEVASDLQYREIEKFRDLSFQGNFREIVEASSLSLAMIIFLDTYTSVAGAPNENLPRELLELYALGVDGGYTQHDVEELSRVITGWTGCKKRINVIDDPLAPCLEQYWLAFPPGKWTATFVATLHDCTTKVLFEGTPQEVVIPDTCAAPDQGVDDLFLALDAIVAHPATPHFIAKKILQRLVTDEPEQELIDEVVAAWNDPGNPHGVGDLRAVLGAALHSSAFLDPDRARGKVKTPLEHLASAIRGTRGRTDGITAVVNFLVAAQQIPHYNPVPTGWPEDGASWIGTNNTLERQNFGFTLLSSTGTDFGAEPLQLLQDNGVSTAPGNAGAIVDFFADAFFGGALTPGERQAAIEFLRTDDLGQVSPYDDARILEAIAFLLGYPQFQEQ